MIFPQNHHSRHPSFTALIVHTTAQTSKWHSNLCSSSLSLPFFYVCLSLDLFRTNIVLFLSRKKLHLALICRIESPKDAQREEAGSNNGFVSNMYKTSALSCVGAGYASLPEISWPSICRKRNLRSGKMIMRCVFIRPPEAVMYSSLEIAKSTRVFVLYGLVEESF